MSIRSFWLALALCLVAVPLPAQRSFPGEHARHGPVEELLRHRAPLDLTAGQVARLEAIGQRMEERNRPLVSRLVELRRRLRSEFREPPREWTPAQRTEFRRRLEAARPLLRQIRENNRAAMLEVSEVLTPAQKARVREMLRERREQGPRPGRRGGLRGPGS